MNGMVRDIKVYLWLAHALLVRQGEKSQSLNLIPIFFILCKTLLLSDICRWIVKEENTEAMGGATTHYHRPLTNKPS